MRKQAYVALWCKGHKQVKGRKNTEILLCSSLKLRCFPVRLKLIIFLYGTYTERRKLSTVLCVCVSVLYTCAVLMSQVY